MRYQKMFGFTYNVNRTHYGPGIFTYVISLNSHNNPEKWVLLFPPFTNKKMRSNRGIIE